LVVLLSLGSAFGYALAAVLQQRSAAAEPVRHSMSPRLVLRLLQRPLWLVGAVVDLGAFGLQALALRHGSLVLVQLLLVSGLLFAFALSAASSRSRLRPHEWLAATVLSAGLAAFVLVASHDRGQTDAPLWKWTVTGGFVLAMSATAVVLARGRLERHEPALLAAAGATIYALTAALTKTLSALTEKGIGRALSAWQLYVLVALCLLAAVTVQSAFQAGSLKASMPTLIAVEPVVSSVVGVFLFHEHLVTGLVQLPALALALAGVAAGIAVLARSPLVAMRS